MKFYIDLKKAQPVENEDGELTPYGQSVVAKYAKTWVSGTRSLELEHDYPELNSVFYDIRVDSSYAYSLAS
jgi:hypothetical protein